MLLITVLLVGFWGHFWTTIVTIGWWPLFIEAWTFVLQVSLAYLWYYTWEPMRAFKGVHMAIGGLLAVASFLQVYMIDVIASYMLTPTNPQNPVRLALNPTSYPLTVHRTVGNLAYIGFAFGGFCAIRYLRAKTAEDKRFYDWAGSFGLLWGVSMTLLQPVVGYSYAKEIQLHSYGSWYKMMFGTLSPVFLWQITLLGIMFLTATLYFARRLRTDEARGSGILKLLSVGMLLTTLLAAQPYALGFSYESVAAAGLNRPFWEGGLINPLGSSGLVPARPAGRRLGNRPPRRAAHPDAHDDPDDADDGHHGFHPGERSGTVPDLRRDDDPGPAERSDADAAVQPLDAYMAQGPIETASVRPWA
ncbi:MAG: hypothetical protein E6J07_07115 [Chloroflexi bacterium]|nr:MAG: hypothetical protein E6J07_07115 [Chloroflexota bacterium]